MPVRQQLLPIKSTCYYKGTTSRTPSPTCVVDGVKFKQMLTQTIEGTMPPEVLDDVTALYMKHANGPIDSAAENAQSIIVDVVNCIYQRYSCINMSTNLVDLGQLNGKSIVSGANADANKDNDTIMECEAVIISPSRNGCVLMDAPVEVNKERSIGFGDASGTIDANIDATNQNNHTRLPDAIHQNDAASGDTEIVPSSGEDHSSLPDSVAETVKVTTSSNGVQDSLDSTQGTTSQKMAMLSNSSVSGNNDKGGSTIAGRTRSRQTSFPSEGVANQVGFVDNPEAILRKRCVKRLASRGVQLPDCNIGGHMLSDDDDDVRLSGNFSNDNSQVPFTKSCFISQAAPPNANVKNTRHVLQQLKDRLSKSKKTSTTESIVEAPKICGHTTFEEGSRQTQNVDDTLGKLPEQVSETLPNVVASPSKFRTDETSTLHVGIQVQQEKSASLDHMLVFHNSSNTSRRLDPPSVNRKTNHSKPISAMDISPPSFRLSEDFDDDGNFIEDRRKHRRLGLSCDGKTIYNDPNCLSSQPMNQFTEAKSKLPSSTNHDNTTSSLEQGPFALLAEEGVANHDHIRPVFDQSPGSETRSSHKDPHIAINTSGQLILLSSQDSPEPPEAQITGARTFHTVCTTTTLEGDKKQNNSHMTCFQKCLSIKFKFQSSSTQKESRHPQRILQPDSYHWNFYGNACKMKYVITTEDMLAYQCLVFLASDPQFASKEVINYDNVRVSYEQLGTLRRNNKVFVDKYVINAFCRKLFKDKKPKDSKRHYFFSTVGDYLLGHTKEGKLSSLHDNCIKCFKLSNQCYSFTLSDYLFFPMCHMEHWFVFVVALRDGYFIFLDSFFREEQDFSENVRSIVIPNFLKTWDEAIGIDWNFDKFMIHHAPVPMQDIKFFSKFDDAVFVMKYLELWHPSVNLMEKFSSINIGEIRIQYINNMIFSAHNINMKAKETVSNHNAVLEMKRSSGFQAASSLFF